MKGRGVSLYGRCLQVKRSRRVSLSPLTVLDRTYIMSTNSSSLLIICLVTLSQGKFKNLLNYLILVVLGKGNVSNPIYLIHIWNEPQMISYNKFLFIISQEKNITQKYLKKNHENIMKETPF